MTAHQRFKWGKERISDELKHRTVHHCFESSKEAVPDLVIQQEVFNRIDHAVTGLLDVGLNLFHYCQMR